MLRSKTTWGSITALVGALAGWATGELEISAALNISVTAILALFLRHGVKKAEDAAS